MLLPEMCGLCDAIGPSPCDQCIEGLPRARDVHSVAGVDHITALLSYEAEVRRLIGALKFRNRRGSFRWLALQIAAQLHEKDFDCVTWVPSSAEGWHKRGYEPSRLLAGGVAGRLRLPAVRLLKRGRDSPQANRDRVARLEGPSIKQARWAPDVRRVLLVDDVCTTGTSLSVAARVLRESGVNLVHAAVVASTPLSAGISSKSEFCM